MTVESFRSEFVAGQRAARVLGQRGRRHPRQPQHDRDQGSGGRSADRSDHRGADPRGSGDRDARARIACCCGATTSSRIGTAASSGSPTGTSSTGRTQPALRPAPVQLVGRSGQGGRGGAAQGRAREAPRPRRSSERRPMLAYIVRRLLLIVPTLFGIMVINFVVIQTAPGRAGRAADPAADRGQRGADVTARVSGTGGGDLAAGAESRASGGDGPAGIAARAASIPSSSRKSSACTASTSRCTSASSR